MILEDRFREISALLKRYLPYISRWDGDAIKGIRLSSPWFDELEKLDPDELAQFDSARAYHLLKSPDWIKLHEDITRLTKFEKIGLLDEDLTPIGNKKKQHELRRLYSFLQSDKGKDAVDFGGGVGNLAYFLEKELSLNMTVLEKDEDLIEKGKKKFVKLGSKVQFTRCHISNSENHTLVKSLHNKDLAIGLHTCGNFANDMLRSCTSSQVSKIVNFGCCYSKITEDDYHLSKQSDKRLVFNQRALSCATLGFGKVELEFYDYRILIMNYKFTFYHWLYKTHGILQFQTMGNSRRSLYKHTFPEFVAITLEKYYPKIKKPTVEDLNTFYASEKNRYLNHYLSIYYAVSRYIGELLEVYILCDRALYLKEHNYQVEIREVFDSRISPRNKAIVGRLV